jgi:DNA-binding protein H-NS
MPTLSDLKRELADVDQLLYAAWLREREETRRRIAVMAVEFQLSPSTVAKDVEAEMRRVAPAPSVLRPPKIDLPLRKDGAPQHIVTKYRNATTGASWTGRGPRPRWLREALDAGAALEDFLVRTGQESAAGDPLRAFQDAARRARLADTAQ